MQAVILAGGRGTRISEESLVRPKPLIEIGGKPIIWHIMKNYSYYGINDFIICCGYKAELVKEYFANFGLYSSDISVDIKTRKITFHKKKLENWKITLIDTGIDTQTGGRIKRVKKYLENTFCLTYGDGVSNVNLKKLLSFHNKHKKIATLTAVRPLPRFGNIKLDKNKVSNFSEKDRLQEGWINGGFFVLNKEVFDYIDSRENCIFERSPLQNLSRDGQLMAFKHESFWHPMDTLRDKNYLNKICRNRKFIWKK